MLVSGEVICPALNMFSLTMPSTLVIKMKANRNTATKGKTDKVKFPASQTLFLPEGSLPEPYGSCYHPGKTDLNEKPSHGLATSGPNESPALVQEQKVSPAQEAKTALEHTMCAHSSKPSL